LPRNSHAAAAKIVEYWNQESCVHADPNSDELAAVQSWAANAGAGGRHDAIEHTSRAKVEAAGGKRYRFDASVV
jgi:hypothetical protein